MFTPTAEQFFNKHGQDRSKPDIAFLKNHFYREGRVSEEQALWILEKTTDILKKEVNVLQVDAPITGPLLSHHSGSYSGLTASFLMNSLWRYPWTICTFSFNLSNGALYRFLSVSLI
jgi:hypothetical protein